VLEKLGYRVDVVGNGKEAVQLLEMLPYDLVLMDCYMPQMDGFEATRVLRSAKDPRLQKIPIVALTAYVTQANIERCLSEGMNECISKPIRIEALKEVLERLLPEEEVGPARQPPRALFLGTG